jgi:DNA-binding response OmpR family regulator
MVLILEAEGYRVDSAPSAEDGLRLLATNRYDLVLSDYALPGHSGVWLLREAVARELMAKHSGLIVTAHPHVKDADGFPVIYKPLDFDAFLDTVRAQLDERQPFAHGTASPGRRRQPRRRES